MSEAAPQAISSVFPWHGQESSVHSNFAPEASLAQQVRDDVLAQILSGALQPGQRINEPDVASRLQVSRVPVREALRALESTGLVESRKHSGVFVRILGMAEIRDLYQMRALMDSFAGRCAAMLADTPREKLLALLDDTLAVMTQAAQSVVVKAYYAENLRFHWAIVEAAGNQELSNYYRSIIQKLHLSRIKNLSKGLGMQASIAQHTEITRAIRNADAAQAQYLLAHHADSAFERLEKAS